jgi:hypothetical protein
MMENLFSVLAQEDFNGGAAAGIGAIGILIYLAIIVACVAGLWKTFAKAGQPGWAAIVPIYNLIILLQIANKPIWWILLMFIPFVNIIVSVLIMISLAQNFSQGAGFGIGLWLLPFIFFPILGFGSAQYVGQKS